MLWNQGFFVHIQTSTFIQHMILVNYVTFLILVSSYLKEKLPNTFIR